MFLMAKTASGGDLAFSDPANVTPPPAWAVGPGEPRAGPRRAAGFPEAAAGLRRGAVLLVARRSADQGAARLDPRADGRHGHRRLPDQLRPLRQGRPQLRADAAQRTAAVLRRSGGSWSAGSCRRRRSKARRSASAITRSASARAGAWTKCCASIRKLAGMRARAWDTRTARSQRRDRAAGRSTRCIRMAGKWYAEKFFGRFEEHISRRGRQGAELLLLRRTRASASAAISGRRSFAEEFKKRKGYDITPELPALFKDIGPRTPKIRLDYSDVMVALTEEGYFKPIFDWHQQRGMTMGCDHGGRGRTSSSSATTSARSAGCKAPAPTSRTWARTSSRPRSPLRSRISTSGRGSGSKASTAAAGARPRPAFVDATFADFVMGYNLLAFHGMYYSTHGGWWEWAPPDNTFRMPYWKHMRGFMDCVQRLGLPAQPGPPPLRRGDPLSGRADGGRHGRPAGGADGLRHRPNSSTARASTSTSWTSSRSPAPRSSARNSTSPARSIAC